MCGDDILAMVEVAICMLEGVEADETADDASVDAFEDGGLCQSEACFCIVSVHLCRRTRLINNPQRKAGQYNRRACQKPVECSLKVNC